MGLIVNDNIMTTLDSAKVLAEQVDKVRDGFLTTPAQFSAEREEMKQQIKKIQAEAAELDRENAEGMARLKKLQAQLEVLESVRKSLEKLIDSPTP